MESKNICPQCGAIWPEGNTCQDHFHQMLFWENENSSLAEVHHLAVLCYYLQHPGLYSPEGLAHAEGLLYEFLERGSHPQEVRQRYRTKVSSDKRIWKIKATPTSSGSYQNPVHWTMTAADVTAGGVENYIENVRLWARSILNALRNSGNFTEEKGH